MNKSLSVKTEFGYGAGYITLSIVGDFMSEYFLYFLNSAAGIAPALAGTILMLGTISNAAANPLVGIYTDAADKKGSRKHRIFIRAIFGIVVLGLLVYAVIPAGLTIRSFYYLLLAVIFYAIYAAYEVPYYAIAATLSGDTDERTSLSSIQTAMSYLGTLLVGIIVPILLDSLVYSGACPQGYMVIMGILTGICLICAWICYHSTKKITEAHLTDNSAEMEAKRKENRLTFQKFRELFHLKPLRFILLLTCSYYIFYNIYCAVFYYYLAYNLQWSGAVIAAANTVYVVLGILCAFLAGRIAIRFDKKKVMIFGMLLGAVSFIALRFTGLHTIPQIAFWFIADNIQEGIFWSLIYTMLYETIDIDEFKNGIRREGTVMGVFTLVAVIGQAIAGQLAGIFLQIGNVDLSLLDEDPNMQLSQQALDTIYSCVTAYPGIFLVFCLVFAIAYPVSRKKLDLFQEAAVKKKNHVPYCTDRFEDIF